MKFKVKDMDIATGDVPIVVLNEKDADLMDLHHNDRVNVTKKGKSIIAILNIAESEKAVPIGRIGFYEEVLKALKAKEGDQVEIKLASKPKSLAYIKQKIDGFELTEPEILEITKDIVENRLSTPELSSFVLAGYMRGLSRAEMVALTKTMAATGTKLNFKGLVADIHSIGGVPGNRCTILVVPILAEAGLIVPKTSSRAITSPAGTADTMEVFAPVALPIPKLYKIIENIGAFIIWGGAIDLAPADDRIIKVEYVLGIDAIGQMVASIMAKKVSVSATHMILEIPYGPGCKSLTLRDATYLQRLFEVVGKEVGIAIDCWKVPGDQPVGNGLGPVLEARDCILAFTGAKEAPKDLIEKSLIMAGKLLEFTGKAKNGYDLAKEILESGRAWKRFLKIVKAQGGKKPELEDLKPGKFKYDVEAKTHGEIRRIDNLAISKIARLAGSPKDIEAGIYLYKHVGDHVDKGEKIFTIYSPNEEKLNFAIEAWNTFGGIEILPFK